MQDNEGFLWIGTINGLNRYNSLDNEVYKHNSEDSLSISNSHINCVFKTKNNEIWVGTANGLNKYHSRANIFTRYKFSKENIGISNRYVKCISEDKNGVLWIGTANGLNKFNAQNNTFEHIYLAAPPTYLNNIITLYHDNYNHTWIGTKGGLYLMANDSISRVEIDKRIAPLDVFEVRDIKQEKDGTIWVATEKHGIYSFVYNNGRAKNIKNFNVEEYSLCSNSVRKMFLDNGGVWLATLNGVAIIENENVLNITYSEQRPDGISSGSVHDIIKDKSGGYYLATYRGGVNYYHPQNNLFSHIEKVAFVDNELTSSAVTCFIEDENKNLWIGTGEGGVSYWDTHKNSVLNTFLNYNKGLSNNNVKCMQIDKNGNLWIGTFSGLNYFSPKTKTVEQFYADPGNLNALNKNQIHGIYIDDYNNAWIGLNGGGCQYYSPEKKKFTTVPGIEPNVDVVFGDSKGRLWVSERYELHCFNLSTKQKINISQYLEKVKGKLSYINHIYEDSRNRIWIATKEYGLIVFDSKKTYWYDKKDGLIDNTVNAILEDDEGVYWISTNKGIVRAELEIRDKTKPAITFTNFSSDHGLKNNQFEHGSAIKLENGILYFGNVNGFVYFNPVNVYKKDYYPKVVFSELRINHESGIADEFEISTVSNKDKLKTILNYSENSITIKFAGINFINPNSTYYQYMLVGYNNNWIEIGNQRIVNFAYLPVGEHELRVKASTNKKNWGKDYSSIKIVVLPPWWRSWWAYSIYILILIIIGYISFLYSQKWSAIKNRLAMEQFEREKEMELHESKLRFFTDVSHELRTPLTLILAPLEKIMIHKRLDADLSKQLKLIKNNGDRMMNLINKVLNLRKLESGHEKLRAAKGNFIEFVKEISLAFSEVAISRQIEFRFEPEGDSLKLWYDRDKLESVIYNLLSNAFKHTRKEGLVRLSVKKAINPVWPNNLKADYEKYVEIAISNTGKAIPEENLKYVFERFFSRNTANKVASTGVGLELTKRMVEMHSGKIFVESLKEPGAEEGITTFTVFLPMGKKHIKEDEILKDFKNSDSLSMYTKELQLSEKVEVPETVENVLKESNDEEKQTILIVEDNYDVRKFICDLFVDNYNVVEARNGLIGWDKATEVIPDLIISDIMMPEMDGIELCRKLKTDIRTSHVPVILLTARTTLSFKYEGIETGADDYITKPFSAQFLTIRVRNLIKQRELLRSYFKNQAILEPEKITVTSIDEKLLKKAVDYISDNMSSSSISVDKLSKELGLSRVHFYRKIKSITNLTAVEFIRSIRLKRAAQLLQQPGLSIKEVQVMVGFESADYFRKCFKEQYNMTPSEYILRQGQ